MPRIEELLRGRPSSIEVFNHQVRDDLSQLVESLNLQEAPADFEEPRGANNAITLSAWEHGGARLGKQDTQITGVPAGVRMTRALVIDADAQVNNVIFTTASTEGVAGEMVDIRGTSVAVFRGCTFSKASTDEPTYIKVANGAKAIFVGCVFSGNVGASGDLFSHAGAAANVQLVGCYNKTTHVYGANTTTTACI